MFFVLVGPAAGNVCAGVILVSRATLFKSTALSRLVAISCATAGGTQVSLTPPCPPLEEFAGSHLSRASWWLKAFDGADDLTASFCLSRMRKSIRVLWRRLVAAFQGVIRLVCLDVILSFVRCICGQSCRQAYAFGAPAAFSAAGGTGILTRFAVIDDAVPTSMPRACTSVIGVLEDELRLLHLGWAGSTCL